MRQACLERKFTTLKVQHPCFRVLWFYGTRVSVRIRRALRAGAIDYLGSGISWDGWVAVHCPALWEEEKVRKWIEIIDDLELRIHE
jgi:hypothetical protein